jgi:hypothetical protein
MVLPAKDASKIKAVRLPEDIEEHEAYRHVVGLIAEVEQENPAYTWDDIAGVLEDHQYTPVDILIGPHLD